MLKHWLRQLTDDKSQRGTSVSHGGKGLREGREGEEKFSGCGKGGLCLKLERMSLWSWHQAGGRKAWVSSKTQQNKPHLPFHAGPGTKDKLHLPSPFAPLVLLQREQSTGGLSQAESRGLAAKGRAGERSQLRQGNPEQAHVQSERLIHSPPG